MQLIAATVPNGPSSWIRWVMNCAPPLTLNLLSNSRYFTFICFLFLSFFLGGGGVQLRSELNSRTATGGGNGLVYPIDLPKTGGGYKNEHRSALRGPSRFGFAGVPYAPNIELGLL